MYEIKGKYTTANITIDNLEDECIAQIISFINHPAFTKPVVIMADAHAGKSSCVGFTMPMTGKVISNVIGVDIGCGVNSVNIGQTLSISLQELDHKIRQQIPFGFDINEKSVLDMKKEFPWRRVNSEVQKFALAYGEKFGISIELPKYDMDWFETKCKIIGCDIGRAIKSIGSTGGGNHYHELGISQYTGDHWFTIHTGSRNFGKCICEYWQDKAVKKVKKQGKDEQKQALKDLKAQYTGKELYNQIKALKISQDEPTTSTFNCSDDLRWLEGEDSLGYLYDMIFAQAYAEENRKRIIETVLGILKMDPVDAIESVHNFIDFRDFIIRKGAIRSYEGERLLIPMNMRDGMLICTGRSNPDWNFSAPHGAGRVLSRSQAKKKLSMDEFKDQMKDIYSTSVCPGTLDEAPGAYKDAKLIEEAIGPTATILDRIKPIHNMKATEKEEE